MRKIVVTEFNTLDGVVEAPGGNKTLIFMAVGSLNIELVN